MFYKYAADITYITKSGKKKNKQARTWVSPKHKKGEVFCTFLGFLCYCKCVSDQNSLTATRNGDSSSHTGRPSLLVHRSKLFLQQLPLSDCHLSLTVTNSSLFTALEPCLSSSSSSIVGNLAHKPFASVSHQNRQRNPLTGGHPHPHHYNECPPPCHGRLSFFS